MTDYDKEQLLDSLGTEWRPIRGFPQYEISKSGHVRNIKTGRTLELHISRGGWYVRLYDRSKHSTRIKSLSKLIYEAYVETPDYRYTIVYKDGDPLNDELSNMSVKPYYRDDCFKAKPVDEYSIDGQLIKTWHSGLSAAKNYGIKPVGIYRCCKGKKPSAGNKVWRWHNEPLNKYKLPVIEPLYPDEEFRRIPDTYAEVSNYGRVRNTRKEGKFYKIRPNGTVRIMTNGKLMQKQVYSLVANAFLPNMFGYTRVMFKDNNKKNCRADNLMWMTDFFIWTELLQNSEIGILHGNFYEEFRNRHFQALATNNNLLKGKNTMINYLWNPKTFIIKAANPCKPGMWCTSINIDYSKVTAISPNKFFSFPLNIRRAEPYEDVSDTLYDTYIGYRNLFGTEYFVGTQYDVDDLDDRGHLSKLTFYEQAEFFRVLFETVMGLSLLRNKIRTYSGEVIQVVCSLPQEFDDSRYWVIIKALEDHHIFDLYLPEKGEWEHFDFTISRILTEPKSFVYSLTDIYREKPEYSDLFKSCPFMFGAELALYLHMNDLKS